MNHHQANEVASCPFCGSKDISDGEVLTTMPTGWTATQSMCRGCGALGPEAKLPEGECDFGDVRAIAAWNRRAAPTEPAVDRDAVAAQFAAWAAEHLGQGYSTEKEDHTYIDPVTRWAFAAWRARAALPAAAQEVPAVPQPSGNSGELPNSPEFDGISAPPSPSVDQAKRQVGGEVAMAWQPIETAPKDGTSVLLYTDEGMIEACWSYGCWGQLPCYATYDGCGGAALSCKPTHWMPLPEAPDRASTGSATSTDTKESA